MVLLRALARCRGLRRDLIDLLASSGRNRHKRNFLDVSDFLCSKLETDSRRDFSPELFMELRKWVMKLNINKLKYLEYSLL